MAPPWAAQMGQGILRHQKGAAHIHRHHRVEIGHLGLINLGAAGDAGAVDHRIQPRQAGKGVPDLVLVGDVADAAVLEGRGNPVDGDDGRAFGLRGLCNRKPKAGGRARHHHMFAGKRMPRHRTEHALRN